MNVSPFGEGAFLVELGGHSAPAVTTHLRSKFPELVVVGTSTHILVEGPVEPGLLDAELSRARDIPFVQPTTHTIAAIYDGEDLAEVARQCRLSTEEVVRLHASAGYTVEFMGFLPGFGYLGGLPRELVVPRRHSPRPRVPRNAIGIVGDMTGVYPLPSPGGWNLIARALGVTMFDPSRSRPTLLQAGDRVRFQPTKHAEAVTEASPMEMPVPRRGLRVVKPGICVTIQDEGRPAQKMFGIPPSGALDVETLRAANFSVGNHAAEAAIEIPQGGFSVVAEGAVTVSLDGNAPRLLRDGDELSVPVSGSAVHYLAVAGGVDVLEVLGSRSTLLVAAMGGFAGRALRKGDVIGVAERSSRASVTTEISNALTIHLLPASDRFAADAVDILLNSTFTISRMSDRVGARLDGARIPRNRPDLARPIPMRRGAVQVTSEGQPVVLGPDHPVTGGYPVIGVLPPSSQAVLARIPVGGPVRFTRA